MTTKIRTQAQASKAKRGKRNGLPPRISPPSENGLHVSEAEYWARYYEHPEFNYEWNNGVLEEKPMADVQNSAIYQWFLVLLHAYLSVRPIARMVNLEIGFRLALPDKTTIRKPDLFVVRNDNPVILRETDRTYTGIADLCVESLSDSNPQEIERDTAHKKEEYSHVGVREYYILDAGGVHMAFYRRVSTGEYTPIVMSAEGVIHSTVLPDFCFRVSDLHRQPSLIKMAADPVYSHFVLPEYQVEKQRAERMAARLRELGIDEADL